MTVKNACLSVKRSVNLPSQNQLLLTEKTCQHCQQSFTAQRRDAKYCSASCRVKAHQRRQAIATDLSLTRLREAERLALLTQEVHRLEEQREALRAEIEVPNQELINLGRKLAKLEEALTKVQTRCREIRKELNTPPWELYNTHFNQALHRAMENYPSLAGREVIPEEHYHADWADRRRLVDRSVKPYLAQLQEELAELEPKAERFQKVISHLAAERQVIYDRQQRIEVERKQLARRIQRLDEMRFKEHS